MPEQTTTRPGRTAPLRVETHGAVATLRLLRPTISGADPELPDQLRVVAEQLSEDPRVRAVLLTGGRRIFAAGADVRGMVECTAAEADAFTARLHRAFSAVARIAKPVVAAIAGYALGGGLELALCADYRMAGQGALLGLPEVGLGIIPGTGGTQRLPRLIGPGPAKRLILTGEQLTADQALRLGLVDEVVPDAELHRAALALTERFAAGPTLALAAAKRAVDEGHGLPLDRGLDLERRLFAGLFGTADQQNGMRAQLTGAPAAFRGR